MEETNAATSGKAGNTLPVWGNEKTMNLNSLILANIQGSPYFKNHLYSLKTYHEVVDEIYYKVQHLEPWEAGSRKTAGQTGMCGGVRGVGAGGIVSSAFCLLYKLYTLKLTRKQLTGMMNHADSPYIRALGFMYARYTLPPPDLWEWFQDYLADEEEIDVKAGGGCVMYMGDVVRDFLMKLDWYGALFPRIPVPVQKDIVARMKEVGPTVKELYAEQARKEEAERLEKEKEERRLKEEKRRQESTQRDPRRGDDHFSRQLEREKDRQKVEGRHRSRSREKKPRHGSRERKHRSRSRDRHRNDHEKSRHHERTERKRSRSHDRHKRHRERSH